MKEFAALRYVTPEPVTVRVCEPEIDPLNTRFPPVFVVCTVLVPFSVRGVLKTAVFTELLVILPPRVNAFPLMVKALAFVEKVMPVFVQLAAKSLLSRVWMLLVKTQAVLLEGAAPPDQFVAAERLVPDAFVNHVVCALTSTDVRAVAARSAKVALARVAVVLVMVVRGWAWGESFFAERGRVQVECMVWGESRTFIGMLKLRTSIVPDH